MPSAGHRWWLPVVATQERSAKPTVKQPVWATGYWSGSESGWKYIGTSYRDPAWLRVDRSLPLLIPHFNRPCIQGFDGRAGRPAQLTGRPHPVLLPDVLFSHAWRARRTTSGRITRIHDCTHRTDPGQPSRPASRAPASLPAAPPAAPVFVAIVTPWLSLIIDLTTALLSHLRQPRDYVRRWSRPPRCNWRLLRCSHHRHDTEALDCTACRC
jgi:hypothetical protein